MAGRETGLEMALIGLRDTLTGVRLPIDLPGTAEQRSAADHLVRQLDDYVLPRLATIDAPLLAVVGGSTGAGKSTLVNSLVGRRVTAPGVIRPTTRAPVLVHHSSDATWFTSARVLPGLARSSGAGNDTRSLQLVADDGIPPGLAILDAPDIDSVVADNRKLATQLLAAADLWLFVTSAARYADAVPWDFLLAAADRSAAVAVVLDRIPPRAMADVPAHLGRLMGERGLGRSPLFAVPETDVDAEGLLPTASDPADPDLAGSVGRRPGQPGCCRAPDSGRGHRLGRPPYAGGCGRPGRAGRHSRPAPERGRLGVRRGRPHGRGADRRRHPAAR